MSDGGGGWYPDPDGQPGRERWWDGSRWTDRTRAPADELAGYAERRHRWPGGRPPRRLVLLAATGVAALGVAAIVVIGHGGNPDHAPAGQPVPPTTAPGQPGPGPVPLSCPVASSSAPTSVAPPSTRSAPPPAAPRVTDAAAGISYAGQGEPWRPWHQVWVTDGLNARFATGYYIVTQPETPEGEYYATVLSGTVATRVADAPGEETRCVAERVAEDVRSAYYPEPNLRRTLDAHALTVSGRPGFLIRYHLSFDVKGYDAKGEQVGVLVLNVGRPQLAVLYISIPDPVRSFDYVIDQVFASVHTP